MPISTLYSQGDVCLVPFPFTDQTGDKKRPGLVVSATWFNRSNQDVVIAAITSQIPSTLKKDHIELTNSDLAALRLPKQCIVKAGKLFAIEKKLIIKKLGRITPGTNSAVLKALQDIFDDPELFTRK